MHGSQSFGHTGEDFMGQSLLRHRRKVFDLPMIVQDQHFVVVAAKSAPCVADIIGHDHIEMFRLYLLLGVDQQLIGLRGEAHQDPFPLALA